MKKGDKISLRLLARGYKKEREKCLKVNGTLEINDDFLKQNPNNPAVRLVKQAGKILNKLDEIETNIYINRQEILEENIVKKYTGIEYNELFLVYYRLPVFSISNNKSKNMMIGLFLLTNSVICPLTELLSNSMKRIISNIVTKNNK